MLSDPAHPSWVVISEGTLTSQCTGPELAMLAPAGDRGR
jgi:hypothetical protein